MAARVVLVDDHQMFREALRRMFETQPDYEVVLEAGDARSFLIEVDQVAFDVAVVDIALPGSDGVALIRELRRRSSRLPATVLLTMHLAADMIAEGLSAGAQGYVFKSQPWPELVAAMGTVLGGGRYLPPRVDVAQIDALLAQRRDGDGASPLAALSTREREVFHLLVRGRRNAAIARELCISVKTVETHRCRIFDKLDVHCLADLVRLAARHNLLLPALVTPASCLDG